MLKEEKTKNHLVHLNWITTKPAVDWPIKNVSYAVGSDIKFGRRIKRHGKGGKIAVGKKDISKVNNSTKCRKNLKIKTLICIKNCNKYRLLKILVFSSEHLKLLFTSGGKKCIKEKRMQ